MSLLYAETLGAPACWKNEIWTRQPRFQALSDPATICLSFHRHLTQLLFPPLHWSQPWVLLAVLTACLPAAHLCVSLWLFPCSGYCSPITTPVTTPSIPKQKISIYVFFRIHFKCSHLPPVLWVPSLITWLMIKIVVITMKVDTALTILNVLHMQVFLMLTSALWRYFNYTHLINGITEAQRGWVIDNQWVAKPRFEYRHSSFFCHAVSCYSELLFSVFWEFCLCFFIAFNILYSQ